ncbi:hypothetical protein LWF15_28240 [Kineosporia rhizophila]|uniref:hypothetical protein n=1 Tax=Kineosporia TaxID=49184 RepID=UPI000ADD50F4|nr:MULTISPECIES: hypothetical protein [Kineosporia]MCE0539393.1 hypothetical protein [Kineosporia rhizophila]GLY19857.1 hypothetical protein Kisp01_68710 [Kineosporia sp. NBRC 101677]
MTSAYPPVDAGLPETVTPEGPESSITPEEPAAVPEPPAAAPKPPVTGDQAVDEAMELVSDASGADLDFQLEAYESAHQTLQDRLADVES